MTIKLSQLRVTADMDAQGYVRGAQQVAQASAAVSAAVKATGKELAALDAAAKDTSAATKGLQRSWVDGYAGASRFEAEIKKLNSELEKGAISQTAAAKVLQGMAGRYGELGSSIEVYKRGLISIAPLVEQINKQSLSGPTFKDQIAQQQEALRIRERIVATHLPEQAELAKTKAIRADILRLGVQGQLTQEETSKAFASETIRHKQSLESIKSMAIAQDKYASGVGLARHEAVNLSRQIQDVVVSLQGGQAPLTVLLQQGTQIADIFAASSANIGAVARSGLAWLGRFAVSLPGIATGIAAIGATAAIAGYQFAESQHEVERALNGVGRASGVTVANINRIAAASKDVSASSARGILSGFAGTGRIGAENSASLLGLTRGFGRQTGQDNAAAGNKLAELFSDPVKGAEELAKSIGGIDAKTMDYIRTLRSKNDVDGAQRALIDAITPRLKEAENNIGGLAKAWNAVSVAASNAWDAVGRATGGQQTAEDKLLYAIEAQRARQQGLKSGTALGRSNIERGEDAIYNLQEQIRLQGRLNATRAEDERLNRRSLEAQGITDKLFGSDAERRALEEQLSKLKDFVNTPGAERMGESFDKAKRALEAANIASAAFLTSVQRIQLSSEISVKSIMARTVAERVAVERMQEQLQLSQGLVNADNVRAETAKRIADINANANRDARDALRQAGEQYSLAGLNPFQRAQREAEIQERYNRERFGGGAAVPATSVPSVGSAAATGLDQNFAAKVRALIDAVGDSGATMTSGFRSREKQQQLYDLYGPGKAAAPGNSQHERGTAMDYTFSSPEARAKAMELAAAYGVRALASNGGAVHFDQGAGRSAHPFLGGGQAQSAGGDAASRIRSLTEATMAEGMFKDALRSSNDNLRQQAAGLELLEKQGGMTAFQIGRMQKAQELTNHFTAQGLPLTDDMTKKIGEEADKYGLLAERMASVKFTRDAMFERSQFGRTAEEQQIASRLRDSGVGLDSGVADMLRMNQLMGGLKETSTDALKGFLSDIRSGKSGMEALKNVADRLLDRLISKAADGLISGLFSGLGGGLFGGGGGGGLLPSIGGLYAKGGVFSQSGVHAFANGGIVNRPTLFPFSKGTGMMGEAGPEAIMPLRRDSRGRLGVFSAANNNSAGASVNVTSAPVITINAPNSDAAALGALRAEVMKLNQSIEKRAVAAVGNHGKRGYV